MHTLAAMSNGNARSHEIICLHACMSVEITALYYNIADAMQ